MSTELLDQCRLEAKRCRKAIAKGSPAAFWRHRIKDWLRRLDEARTVLQILLEEIESPRPEPQHRDDGGGNRDDDDGGA